MQTSSTSCKLQTLDDMVLSSLFIVVTAAVVGERWLCHSTMKFWCSKSDLTHQARLPTEPSCRSICILMKTLKAHSIGSFNFSAPICQVYHSSLPSAMGRSQVGAGMRNSGCNEPTLCPSDLDSIQQQQSIPQPEKKKTAPATQEINYTQGNLPAFCLTPFLNILIADPKLIKYSLPTVRRLPRIQLKASLVFILPDRKAIQTFFQKFNLERLWTSDLLSSLSTNAGASNLFLIISLNKLYKKS